MNIDQMIWQSSPSSRRSQEEWTAIAKHLVRTLGEYLDQKVELVEVSIIDGEALCCSIRSIGSSMGHFARAWEGILGLDVIEDKPDVSASLFLFSQGNRLAVSGQTGSYLEFLYEPAGNNSGQWRSLGWLEDVYNEYQSINKYTGGDNQ